jgi:methylated-DNA-[protein]-cysteine S-methyltransferase
MTTTTKPTTLITMTIDSPLGPLRLLGDERELVGVYLPAQIAPAAPEGRSRVLALAAAQLAEYFAGERREFDVPLGPRGTAFQQLVWRQLGRIPFGETRSYGELAHALGRPSASRAVGAANGRNPISILVPCHRVIAGSGALTGYAGGLEAKEWLLAHEARGARGAGGARRSAPAAGPRAAAR